MYSKPWTVGGIKPFSSFGCTFGAPRIMWVDGLVKSKSNKPTLQPLRAKVNASVVATMLFPTPPLPLETAIIRLILLKRSLITLVRGSTTIIWLLLCSQAKRHVHLRFQSQDWRI